MKLNTINSFGRKRSGHARWGARALLAALLVAAMALLPLPALAVTVDCSDAGSVSAPSDTANPVAAVPAVGTASPEAAPAETGDSAAPDSEKTYSVTFYHSEAVYYDDPTYVPEDDPRYKGYRLLRAVTVDGFKAGDVVYAMDYIGREPGFTFYDGWPREIVVSEDESKNAFQLNYFRNMSNCTVNHFVITEPDGVAGGGEGALPGRWALRAPSIKVIKVASESLDNQLFADVLESESFADVAKLADPDNPGEVLDGMTLVGTYPQKLQVAMDPQKNEMNLYYADATVHLPDDVPTDDADSDQGGAGNGPDEPDGDAPGNGGPGSAPDGGEQPDGSAPDGPGSNGGVADTDADAGEGSGPDAASDADRPQQSIPDDRTPLAAQEAPAAHLPQTGDDGLVVAAAVAGLAAAAVAIGAACARRRS